ncbi:MAG: hypothetical protein KAH21_11865 [Spirochaetaceae bacterium]|nr:hypothetical protein [Spirochaetaceae bacterium]
MMETNNLKDAFNKLKYGEDAFHELMRWRIRRILLVLPHYDAWILEHDAKLSDQIVGEYHQLNLTTVPRMTTVSDGDEALEMLGKQSFDLMIIGVRVGDLSPGELAENAKSLQKDLAVLMLLSSRSDLAAMEGTLSGNTGPIDARFLWTGDSRLFLAMIKYVEDFRNAPDDTKDGRVGVLLVVEDSIPFYSSYLPLLYGEIMTQTQRLIAEEMNDSDKYWRMRTRPKVLLARTWEEAVTLGERYREALIGIVSDIAFSRNGGIDEKAGFSLIERFREMDVNIPVLFQSSDDSLASDAGKKGARFQGKLSGDLHRGIRRFILEELGFGDFVFYSPDGEELKRVRTLRDFELAIGSLPVESILYHAERDDYSRWMAAHGEYQVARRIKPVRLDDFPSPESHREFLVQSFREVRERRHRGRLVDFRFDNPGVPGSVARYGSGSLGGKGRGLAFFNALLNTSPWEDHFSLLRVEIPQTLIIATGEFDRFLDEGNLPPDHSVDDLTLRRAFLEKKLPESLMDVLRAFSESEPGPLAVRSSALLEDSQSIPFAGIYDTYMIPEIPDEKERLKLLSDALRLVWASTYSKEATVYRDSLGVGREEEKMAVIVQQLTGSRHGEYWFPRLSGTAQSLNYYPVGPMDRDDGAARIAIGLGRSVVGGDRGFLFSPRYPSVPWGTEEDRWREGQTHFWAIHNTGKFELVSGESSTLEQLTIRDAENLDILRHMTSTWDSASHRLVDGIDTPGPRVVDFRDILEYEWLPLSPLLDQLLIIARSAMGIPVELEFSMDWKGDLPENAVFSLLQVRPLISQLGLLSAVPERPSDMDLLLRSGKSLGHGVIEDINDVIWVDPDLYDPGDTENLRDEVAAMMDELARQKRYTVLIGPGRWGSRDRFLGIPVSWTQVRQARLIVEVTRKPGDPEPSQGSHFFHNLVALGVGYAHISSAESDDLIDWEFLRKNSSGTGIVRLSHFEKPLNIVMDGKNGLMWVVK